MRTNQNILTLIFLFGIYLGPSEFSALALAFKPEKTDSTKVTEVCAGFYSWYIACLKNDSTYNIIQPLYKWKDKIPILETSKYITQLQEHKFVSEHFIEYEKKRFKICQDSLNNIDYKAVMDCGCSVGEFFKECEFIDYYYWLMSQEYPDSVEVKGVQIKGDMAICELRFYWMSENFTKKSYDENFSCKLYLTKSKETWLIDSIEIKRN
jgi:hypothetical protein